MKPLYTAVVTVHGGREGHAHSSDGILDVDLRKPKELGGPGGAGTNPDGSLPRGMPPAESAIRAVAQKQKLALTDVQLTAHVTFNRTDDMKNIIGGAARGHGRPVALTL